MPNTLGVEPKGRAERVQQLNYEVKQREVEKKAEVNNQIDAINHLLKTKLQEVQTALIQIDSSSDFGARAASLTEKDNPIISASAGSDTLVGKYEFTILKLATESKRIGSADVGTKLSATADVSGVTISSLPIARSITAGVFTVNGAQVTVDIADSLETVLNAIDTATGSIVTAVYNPTTDKIDLSSASTIVLGSAADSSNFLEGMKLIGNGTTAVSSQAALGIVDLESAIDSANLTVTPTSGTLAINGISVTYDVTTDSIGDVIRKINGSEAGVTVTYDAITDKFTIVNDESGKFDITASDNSGNLLEVLGLNSGATLSYGDNAEFKLNGGSTFYSSSNILGSSSHGVDGLAVTAIRANVDESVKDTVTVTQDVSETRSRIETFFEKLNNVQSFIAENSRNVVKETTDENGETAYKTIYGAFGKNNQVKSIAKDLFNLATNTIKDFTGDITRLSDIGIGLKSTVDLSGGFSTSSKELVVTSSSKFEEFLGNRASEVARLFTEEVDSADAGSGGIAPKIRDYVNNLSSTTGNIS